MRERAELADVLLARLRGGDLGWSEGNGLFVCWRGALLFLAVEGEQIRHLSRIDERRLRAIVETRSRDDEPPTLVPLSANLKEEIATKSDRASYLEWLEAARIQLSGGVGDLAWSLRAHGARFIIENADGRRELLRAQVQEMIATDRYGWVYFSERKP